MRVLCVNEFSIHVTLSRQLRNHAIVRFKLAKYLKLSWTMLSYHLQIITNIKSAENATIIYTTILLKVDIKTQHH